MEKYKVFKEKPLKDFDLKLRNRFSAAFPSIKNGAETSNES